MKPKVYKIKSKQTLKKIKAEKNKKFVLKFVLFALTITLLVLYFPINWVIKIEQRFYDIIDLDIFTLKSIKINGNHKLTNEEIISISQINIKNNIFNINLNNALINLKNNGWIKDASIRRILPSQLVIKIKERICKAVWINDDKYYCLSSDGAIICEVEILENDRLIVLGNNANIYYGEVVDQLFHTPFYSQIFSISRISNRRWNLDFKNGMKVKLPHENLSKAIGMLEKIMHENENSYNLIDLRLIPDKIYIQLKDKVE